MTQRDFIYPLHNYMCKPVHFSFPYPVSRFYLWDFNFTRLKRILIPIVLIVVLIAAMLAFYTSFDRKATSPAAALMAIPQSAALILETSRAGDLWHDLSQTNLMWEELEATDYFFRLNAAAEAFDSLLTREKEFRAFLADKPLAVSVHVSGARDYSFLLSMPVREDVTSKKLISTLPTIFRASGSPEKRLYDGVNLYAIDSEITGKKIYFFRKDGLLVMSMSSIIAEEAIRALQQNASVLHNPDFTAVRKTRGIHTRGELYINYEMLKVILRQNVSDDSAEMDFFQYPYAAWSALDLKLKANSISLNGFVLCRDSSDAWIGSFRETKAPTMKVLRYMPSNTAFFAFLGFGDFKTFRERQLNIYGRTNRKYDIEQKLEKYSDRCNCDIKNLGLSWIGDQASAFITEPASVQYAQNHFAVFRADNINTAWDKLLQLESNLGKGDDTVDAIETFKGVEIHRLKIGAFYSAVLSEAFLGLNDPYFVRMNDMILMGTSLNGMRSLVQKLKNNYDSGNTLASDERFLELGNQVSGTSHFVIYSSLARSPFVYQNVLSSENAADIEKQTEVLRKFQAFIYQVGYYKKDLYYNTVYFKYNPRFKKETSSLWEKKLKAEIRQKPVFLNNHYTDALEILVQDVENRIYLIGNTGKILWEQKVDGPIRSDVVQVDVYRNKKLQMLFSTDQSIYLLDRNGNNVESYPVRLPAKASNGVSVADYDNSRHYRFFIGVDGGKILCYNVEGKQVEGWDFDGASANISSKIKAIRIKSRDYIFALDSGGKIHLLNRRGKARHKVSQQLESLAPGTIAFDLGGSIKKSGIYYMDTLGNAYRQGFNDRFSKIDLTNERVLSFAFEDIDTDGSVECLVLTPDAITAYSLDGEIRFENSLPGSDSYSLQVFQFPGDKIRIGITNPEKQTVTLYNSNGKVHSGFPLYGHVPFIIGDMNRDGYFNLITAGSEGFVVAYALE